MHLAIISSNLNVRTVLSREFNHKFYIILPFEGASAIHAVIAAARGSDIITCSSHRPNACAHVARYDYSIHICITHVFTCPAACAKAHSARLLIARLFPPRQGSSPVCWQLYQFLGRFSNINQPHVIGSRHCSTCAGNGKSDVVFLAQALALEGIFVYCRISTAIFAYLECRPRVEGRCNTARCFCTTPVCFIVFCESAVIEEYPRRSRTISNSEEVWGS